MIKMKDIEKRIENIEERLSVIEEKLNIIPKTEEPKETKPEKQEQKKNKKEKQPIIPHISFHQIITFLGISGIIIGLISFYTYAVMNQWIGHSGQILLGLLSGLILFQLAYTLRTKHPLWSNIVFGGAYFIEYLSIGYGTIEYHVIPKTLAIILSIIALTSSLILTYRFDSKTISYFSLIGGSLIPYICNFQHNIIYTLTYYTMLSIALVTISLFKNWSALRFISFTLMFLYTIVVTFTQKTTITAYKLPSTIFVIITFTIYNIASVIRSLKERENIKVLDIITLSLLPIFSIIPLTKIYNPGNTGTGFIIILLSFIYLIELLAIKKYSHPNETLKWTLLSIAYLSVNTGIIYLITDTSIKYYIVLLYASQWMALSIISKRTEEHKTKKIYEITSYILFFITILNVLKETKKNLFLYSYIPNSFYLQLNETIDQYKGVIITHHIILMIINISIAYGIYYLYKTNKSKIYGTFLMLYPYYLIYNIIDISEYIFSIIKSNTNHQIFSVILSIFWLIYSLTIYDKTKNTKYPKYIAVLLLTITLIKIASVDLLYLEGIYRITGFIIFGILLLLGGYKYGKKN